jgi:putative glutamine amidotransferase
VPDPDYADRLVELIHGVILIGSAYDMDAARYGQESRKQAKPSFAARDDIDALLLERAYSRTLPVLGICHGCQAINVFAGGSLIHDIGDQVGSALQHRTRSGTGEYAHKVSLLPDTILNATSDEVHAEVNSAHDQAIDRLGKDLRVIAQSSDGVIEAVEHDDMDRHFILGVQWHPERLAATDDLSFRVFQRVVDAAAVWQARHPT